MPYILREDKAEEIFDIAIYTIVFHSDKTFIVSKSKISSLEETYKTHYYLKNKKTAAHFAEAKNAEIHPPMYVLSELKTSQRKAFLHLIAWTKYFKEHGYTSLSGNEISKYVDDLRDEALLIYEEIKNKPFDEVCPEGGGLFHYFGKINRKSKEKDESFIAFRTKSKEYRQIKKAADSLGISMSEYCKRMALSGRVINVELDAFKWMSEATKKFNERDKLLKQILYEIYQTGKYYPADLEIIQKAITDNLEQQDKEYEELHKVFEILLD